MQRPLASHQKNESPFHDSHVVFSYSFVKITLVDFNNFDVIVKRLNVTSDYNAGATVALNMCLVLITAGGR